MGDADRRLALLRHAVGSDPYGTIVANYVATGESVSVEGVEWICLRRTFP